MTKVYLRTLTKRVFAIYANRKKPGRLGLIVDTRDNRVYIVPKDQEHIDYVKHLTKESNFSKLIPSYIDFEKVGNQVIVAGIETGYSGIERILGVKHESEDLEKAHSLVHSIVNKGEIPVVENITSRISFKFSTRKTA